MIKPNNDNSLFKRIETKLTWQDLPSKKKANHQLKELENWLTEDLKSDSSIHRSHLALFSGASASDKTLAASLLGKYSNRDVYRVDLGKVVSKYIGETEKNLNILFERAVTKNWILFFDEADAIFGKRTSVSDSHDRFANQEVSYLMQKIDSHVGLVILSTISSKNINKEALKRIDTEIEI